MTTVIKEAAFEKVYELVKALWPSEMVTEHYILPSGGMRIPILTQVHDSIEERVEVEFEGLEFDVAHAVEFAIFTSLHKAIKEGGLNLIKKSDFNKEEVKRIINSYEAWEISE